MTLDYNLKGKVKITMLDYIKAFIECFEREESRDSVNKSSAAPLNLFCLMTTVRISAEKNPRSSISL